MASSPMLRLWESKWKMPHALDKKHKRKGAERRGQPRFALYFAEPGRFTEPGIYFWVGLTKSNSPLRRSYRILKGVAIEDQGL